MEPVARAVRKSSGLNIEPSELVPDGSPRRRIIEARLAAFASRYAAGSAVVVLEPDVAAAFPSSGEANEAWRALAGIIQKHRHRRSVSRRSL
jgi:hypothetical protein